MTKDELFAYGKDGVERAPENAAFFVGIIAAALGSFADAGCAPAGYVDESTYCEGGREGLLRLSAAAPTGRIAHGEVVDA